MKNLDLTLRARGVLGRLCEVGKKISKKNADRLRKAMQEISELLALVDADESLTEAERSQNERARLLTKAVKDRVKADSDYYYCWIENIFDTWLVYYHADTFWRCDYSIADDGAVTLGAATEVIPRMSYDPAPVAGVEERFSGHGDAVALYSPEGLPVTLGESELSEATAQIKLIDPGWGSSGYYSAEMLKRDGPAAFPKGTHMYLDHMSEREKQEHPENSVKRLAAVLEGDAQWQDNGPRGPALYAPARIGKTHETLIKDFRDDIGVSISAGGVRVAGEAEGRKGYVITKLDPRTENPFNSVDFVTLPGRGGEIVSLFEAAGRKPTANPTQENTQMNEEQVKALIAESQKPLVEQLAAANTKVTALETTNARLTETLALQGAKAFVTERLAKITMPAVTRQRLIESLPNLATLKDGVLDVVAFGAAIDEAAKSEMMYLASINPGGVRGMGVAAQEAAEPKAEDIDNLLAANLAKLGGLTEAAAKVAATGLAA